MTLAAGQPFIYWQVSDLSETPYDVKNAPMEGEMDSTFFLTKDKNIIPHTYPCRTDYVARISNKKPVPFFPPDWSIAHNVLPLGSKLLDLSGFWFRATRVGAWARTKLLADEDGHAVFQLGICGAALLVVNGKEAGWLAPATRNAMHFSKIEAQLQKGENEIAIWFEDLAERDAVLRVDLRWETGPSSKEIYPYDQDEQLVRQVEVAIDAMHLNKKSYNCEDVFLELPRRFPDTARLQVNVLGHFMAQDQRQIDLEARIDDRKLFIANSQEFPADYRYFVFEIDCGGFKTRARLGAELSQSKILGQASDDMLERIAESLNWVADHAETGSVLALALVDRGSKADLAKAEEVIATILPRIEQCYDCADFALVPLIWVRFQYGEKLSAALRERIDAAMLQYRYWMDEPGNDVQWYFSENHALLFHTAAYLAGHFLQDAHFERSGRNGHEQSKVGATRLREWFDHFEKAEMAEFNSATYFPIDLKGLCTIFALAPDADLRERAANAIQRLAIIIANSNHQGFLTAAQGRSYEHSLCSADTLELTGISRLLWGQGSYGAHVECLSQMALCLRDFGLELPELTKISNWRESTAVEWCFVQGEDKFAHLYHYKTRNTALGTAAKYRWFDWGYQETLLHARIGSNPHAQIWINQPGEMVQSGFGRPSYWGGSASIPRVQQFRNLALISFQGVSSQIPFTHAWFPTVCFDECLHEGARASARSASGMLTIRASDGLELITEGSSAHHELRLAGLSGIWIIRLGEGSSLADFQAMHALNFHIKDDETIVIDDTEYGEVHFQIDGKVSCPLGELYPHEWSVEGTQRILPHEIPIASGQ